MEFAPSSIAQILRGCFLAISIVYGCETLYSLFEREFVGGGVHERGEGAVHALLRFARHYAFGVVVYVIGKVLVVVSAFERKEYMEKV